MPSATQKQLRRVIELCSGTKLKFQSLPGVGDLIDGRVTVSQIRPVDINDLLGREAVALDSEAIGAVPPRPAGADHRGRREHRLGDVPPGVPTTSPARLILVEQAENPLFEIENELRAKHAEIPLVAVHLRHLRPPARDGRLGDVPPGGGHPRRRPQARAADGAQPLRGRQEQRPGHPERGRRRPASTASASSS